MILDLWTVEWIMTRRLHDVAPGDSVAEARRMMEVNEVRHLPVVHRERLVGLLSERDVLRLASAELDHRGATERRLNALCERTDVEEVMVRDVVTVHPDTPISHAARLMIERKLGCLPVVDNDQHVVGIITMTEMLKMLIDCQWLLDPDLARTQPKED